MKKRIAVLALVVLGAAGGYSLRFVQDVIERHKAELEKAKSSFYLFRNMGFPRAGRPDRDQVAAWRKYLKDDLENDLKAPFISSLISDYDFGCAFLVLRDPGEEHWGYTEGMEKSRQDEMIRYLSFRISKCPEYAGFASWPDIGRGEFKALLTYPQEAVTRNSAIVEPAIRVALFSGAHELDYYAMSFIAYHLSEP